MEYSLLEKIVSAVFFLALLGIFGIGILAYREAHRPCLRWSEPETRQVCVDIGTRYCRQYAERQVRDCLERQ